jgi:hypothetical protein
VQKIFCKKECCNTKRFTEVPLMGLYGGYRDLVKHLVTPNRLVQVLILTL